MNRKGSRPDGALLQGAARSTDSSRPAANQPQPSGELEEQPCQRGAKQRGGAVGAALGRDCALEVGRVPPQRPIAPNGPTSPCEPTGTAAPLQAGRGAAAPPQGWPLAACHAPPPHAMAFRRLQSLVGVSACLLPLLHPQGLYEERCEMQTVAVMMQLAAGVVTDPLRLTAGPRDPFYFDSLSSLTDITMSLRADVPHGLTAGIGVVLGPIDIQFLCSVVGLLPWAAANRWAVGKDREAAACMSLLSSAALAQGHGELSHCLSELAREPEGGWKLKMSEVSAVCLATADAPAGKRAVPWQRCQSS